MSDHSLFDLPAAPKRAPTTDRPTTDGMPEWLKRRLEGAGLMDPGTGATRRARAARCPTCRRPVMRGIDRDWGGLSIDCDPTPLSPEGEAIAIYVGRRTYELRWLGDRYEIDRRDASGIRGNPIGTLRLDVLVQHEHGGRSFPSGSSNIGEAWQWVDPGDIPPY
jgi:hypothetical protein